MNKKLFFTLIKLIILFIMASFIYRETIDNNLSQFFLILHNVLIIHLSLSGLGKLFKLIFKYPKIIFEDEKLIIQSFFRKLIFEKNNIEISIYNKIGGFINIANVYTTDQSIMRKGIKIDLNLLNEEQELTLMRAIQNISIT